MKANLNWSILIISSNDIGGPLNRFIFLYSYMINVVDDDGKGRKNWNP